jgi:hypothetical protein
MPTKRVFVLLLLCGMAFGQKEQEFVVEVAVDTTHPIHVRAKDRLWAESKALHTTVWTIAEWNECAARGICGNPVLEQQIAETRRAESIKNDPIKVDDSYCEERDITDPITHAFISYYFVCKNTLQIVETEPKCLQGEARNPLYAKCDVPEPEDVPAIWVHVSAERGVAECFSHEWYCEVMDRDGHMSGQREWELVESNGYRLMRASCADKLRILEHDESEPPHYYCRKPQTESK